MKSIKLILIHLFFLAAFKVQPASVIARLKAAIPKARVALVGRSAQKASSVPVVSLAASSPNDGQKYSDDCCQ